MILKTFGFIDLIIAVIVFAHAHVPRTMLIYASSYLVVKGLIFVFMDDPLSISNWLNYVDLIIAGYVVLLSYNIAWMPMTIIAGFFLIQKGLFSFV